MGLPNSSLKSDFTNPNFLANIVDQYSPTLENSLSTARSHTIEQMLEESIIKPAKHLLNKPGKSFRSNLVEISWSLAQGQGECPQELMNMIELLHTGSLIVDDIQDNAETRRGLPALHQIYGTPLALNTGNWLYFVALSQLSKVCIEDKVLTSVYQKVMQTLIQCHQGQALDLSVDITTIPQAQIPSVVRTTTKLKTGALMSMAAYLGAAPAYPSTEILQALTLFGKQLGIALQMLDDLSGILNTARQEKGSEDLQGLRPTWVWAFLSDSTDEVTFARLQKQAKESNENNDLRSSLISDLKTFLKESAPFQIQSHIHHSFESLTKHIAPCDAIETLRQECERLLASYL